MRTGKKCAVVGRDEVPKKEMKKEIKYGNKKSF